MKHEDKNLGLCPICAREMIAGPSVNEHHWVPKSQGGTAVATLHKICHRMIHELFDEKELSRDFDTAEKLRAHPDMAAFIQWVAKKPADYVDWPKSPRTNKRKGAKKPPPIVVPTGR